MNPRPQFRLMAGVRNWRRFFRAWKGLKWLKTVELRITNGNGEVVFKLEQYRNSGQKSWGLESLPAQWEIDGRDSFDCPCQCSYSPLGQFLLYCWHDGLLNLIGRGRTR